MRLLREIGGALTQGLITTVAQPRHTLLTAAGFLIAGGMLLGLLAIPAGLARLAGHTGLADVALVRSSVPVAAQPGGMDEAGKIALIGNLPGVAHDPDGDALVAPQFAVNVKLRRFDGTEGDVLIRGVSPAFWKVIGHHVRISGGRPFRPGLRELLAGDAVAKHFVALDIGSTVSIRKSPWRVSGHFDAGTSLWGSEIWTDIGSLQSALNMPGHVTSLWVKLTSPAAFPAFDAALRSNAGLKNFEVQRQPDYYRWQIGFIYRYARIGAWSIAILLGIAASLTISNTLNMALAARRRETAILRAIGFRRIALALALWLEITLTGLVCTGIVILIGWLELNGRSISTSTFFQSVDFQLQVGPKVALSTIVFSVFLGTVAALWPISRATRAPMVKMLRGE